MPQEKIFLPRNTPIYFRKHFSDHSMEQIRASEVRIFRRLFGNPRQQNLKNIFAFFRLQGSALVNLVPFGKASPAAGRRRVLGDENRVSLHGRLPAVVLRMGRAQSILNKLPAVVGDKEHPLLADIIYFTRRQSKTPAECTLPQSLKYIRYRIGHGMISRFSTNR